LEHRYARNTTAVSIWTMEPAFGGRSCFTSTAQMTLPGALGVLLGPVLWRMFKQINVAPFIQAAQAHHPAGTAQEAVS
jgi:hypothetical protein